MFDKKAIFMLCFCSICADPDLVFNSEAGIIGDGEVDIADYPFAVAIVANYAVDDHTEQIFVCSGSLISPSWVLTAANCVEKTDVMYTVYAGSAVQFQGYEFHVKKIVIHDDYTVVGNRIENDIALVELTSPAVCDFCEPTYVRAVSPEISEEITVLGWGNSNCILQSSRVQVMDESVCINRVSPLMDMTSVSHNLFCAGKPNSHGTNMYDLDRGGPAIYENEIVGIVSCSAGTKSICNLGWYTNVGSYMEWINGNINE